MQVLISVNFLQLLVGPTTKDQTKNTVLNPPIEAQYFRINPQYWSYSLMCLRTELYGCSGEQGKMAVLYRGKLLVHSNIQLQVFTSTLVLYFWLAAQPSAPTPLLQASGMCIKPQRGNCQPPDGTILVLTQKKPCDQPFMQFSLSADGTLKHHCSGKMVCPRKPAQGKRCELMISSKCQPQDAKFERTAGMISKYI